MCNIYVENSFCPTATSNIFIHVDNEQNKHFYNFIGFYTLSLFSTLGFQHLQVFTKLLRNYLHKIKLEFAHRAEVVWIKKSFKNIFLWGHFFWKVKFIYRELRIVIQSDEKSCINKSQACNRIAEAWKAMDKMEYSEHFKFGLYL